MFFHSSCFTFLRCSNCAHKYTPFAILKNPQSGHCSFKLSFISEVHLEILNRGWTINSAGIPEWGCPAIGGGQGTPLQKPISEDPRTKALNLNEAERLELRELTIEIPEPQGNGAQRSSAITLLQSKELKQSVLQIP